MLFLILYILFGFIFTLYGPLASKIKTEKTRLLNPSPAGPLSGRQPVSKRKIRLFFIFLTLLSVLFYPFFFAVLALDFFREKGKDVPEPFARKTFIPLYFNRISGFGKLICHTCGHEENLTAFLHGDDEDDEPSMAAGFQCQSCGKFKTFDEKTVEDEPKICDCGGTFSREDIIFCPVCTSHDVAFKTAFMF